MLCAIHGELVAKISSLGVFTLCPWQSIFLAGGSEQPRPPTRSTRVPNSACSIFRDHPQHDRPKLNCPLQATLAMQCNGAVAGPHALPGLPWPRPNWKMRLWSPGHLRPPFKSVPFGRGVGPSATGRGVPRQQSIDGAIRGRRTALATSSTERRRRLRKVGVPPR